MRTATLVLLALLMAPPMAHAADDRLTGPAKVRGPDMLVIAGARVKLSGVVAPEEDAVCAAGLSCGDAATAALGEVVAGGDVTCIKEHRLGHGFFLGHCRASDGSDPAEALLMRGLLLPDPGGSTVAYQKAAASAQAERAGLWGS